MLETSFVFICTLHVCIATMQGIVFGLVCPLCPRNNWTSSSAMAERRTSSSILRGGWVTLRLNFRSKSYASRECLWTVT